MKRLFFLAIILLAGFARPSAQSVVLNNPDNAPFWGIRVGYDHTFPCDWHLPTGDSFKMFKSGPGFSAGAVYNMPVVANMYFEPGVSVYFDTYNYYDLIVSGSDGSELQHDPSVSKFGFRIPLTVGYRFDVFENGGFNVFTGPQVDFGVTAKVNLDNKVGDTILDSFDTSLYDGKDGLRRFDLGWRFGAGVYVGRWSLELSGTLGMLDLNKNAASFRENRLSVTLGYNF